MSIISIAEKFIITRGHDMLLSQEIVLIIFQICEHCKGLVYNFDTLTFVDAHVDFPAVSRKIGTCSEFGKPFRQVIYYGFSVDCL